MGPRVRRFPDRTTAASLNNAAAFLYKKSQLREALELYSRARTILEHSLAHTPSARSEVQNGLNDGRTLTVSLFCGDSPEETRENNKLRHLHNNCLVEAMGKQEKRPCHLGSSMNLRCAKDGSMSEIGMYQEETEDDLGTEYFADVMLISEEDDEGDFTQQLAITAYNMALVHYHLGHLDASLDLFQFVTSVRPTLKCDEKVVVASLNNIGRIYYHKGLYDEARKAFSQALQRGVESLCSVSRTLSIDYAAGLIYDELCRSPNKRTRATEKLRKERLLQISTTMTNLGRLCLRAESLDDSMLLCQTTLAIRQRFLGCNHWATALVLYNVGLICHKQGDLDKALIQYLSFIEQAASILGGKDREPVAAAMHQIGLVQSAKREYDTAMTTLSRALELRRAIHGNFHSNVAKTLFSIGQICFEQGRNTDAMLHFEETLQISRSVLEENNMIFVFTLSYLGQICSSNGEIEAALGLYEEAVDTAKKVFGSDHHIVVNILHAIGHLYASRRMLSGATAAFEQAGAISVRSFLRYAIQLGEIGGVCHKIVARAA